MPPSTPSPIKNNNLYLSACVGPRWRVRCFRKCIHYHCQLLVSGIEGLVGNNFRPRIYTSMCIFYIVTINGLNFCNSHYNLKTLMEIYSRRRALAKINFQRITFWWCFVIIIIIIMVNRGNIYIYFQTGFIAFNIIMHMYYSIGQNWLVWKVKAKSLHLERLSVSRKYFFGFWVLLWTIIYAIIIIINIILYSVMYINIRMNINIICEMNNITLKQIMCATYLCINYFWYTLMCTDENIYRCG